MLTDAFVLLAAVVCEAFVTDTHVAARFGVAAAVSTGRLVDGTNVFNGKESMMDEVFVTPSQEVRNCCPHLHTAHQSQWSGTRRLSEQIQDCRYSRSFQVCCCSLRCHHTRPLLCIHPHLVMDRHVECEWPQSGNYIHLLVSAQLTATSNIVAVAKCFFSSAGAKSRLAEAGILRTCITAGSIIPTQAWVLCTLVNISKERTQAQLTSDGWKW